MAVIGGAVIGVVGSVASSEISSSAASSAANKQRDAANAANVQQRADQKPWMDSGKAALDTLTKGAAPGGQLSTPFTMADATNSEAEKFAMSQGTEAIQNSAAARGGLLNTNTLQDLDKFGAGVGAQYEGQAFNQWLQSRQQQINMNQSLAGEGMQTASNVADNSANLTMAGANAEAAGTVGSANATQSGITNSISMLSKLFGNNTNSATSATADPGYNYDPGGSAISDAQFGGGSAGDYSDERLKTNIRRVGTSDKGLPIYTYRMKGGGPVKMGVMAQDVEKINPGAVSHDRHGMKMVDYERI